MPFRASTSVSASFGESLGELRTLAFHRSREASNPGLVMTDHPATQLQVGPGSDTPMRM